MRALLTTYKIDYNFYSAESFAHIHGYRVYYLIYCTFFYPNIIADDNGIHYKFMNVRKSKNVGSYHSNQVAWQRSVKRMQFSFKLSTFLNIEWIP